MAVCTQFSLGRTYLVAFCSIIRYLIIAVGQRITYSRLVVAPHWYAVRGTSGFGTIYPLLLLRLMTCSRGESPVGRLMQFVYAGRRHGREAQHLQTGKLSLRLSCCQELQSRSYGHLTWLKAGYACTINLDRTLCLSLPPMPDSGLDLITPTTFILYLSPPPFVTPISMETEYRKERER